MSFANLPSVLHHQSNRLGPRTALRFRRHGLFRDISWSQYREQVVACASALVAAGISTGDRIGLLSENRVEWLIADMGIMTAGAINVPSHAALPGIAVARQLADSGANWLFVSTRDQLDKMNEVRASIPSLKGVVVFDRLAEPVGAVTWAGFLQQGRANLSATRNELARRESAQGRDDLATIMYTSGTTGMPKGVMLTHGNLLSNAEAVREVSGAMSDVVQLSWLPYSHIFARLCDHYTSLFQGYQLVLSESVDTVAVDLQEIQPTHMNGVPRFFEKMLAASLQKNPSDPGKVLKAIFGRRLVWLMSGGAPLPIHVEEAYHAAGIPLLQGYGLTESAPVLTTNRQDNFRTGSAGLPVPGVVLRISQDGEILARGPNIMKGYWNQTAATAATIRDGWLHTGDVGRIDDHGFLYITGRKKELLVLSNGKKVVPTELEAALQADPCIEQVVVFGDGRQFLTAVIVPVWNRVRQDLATAGTIVGGSDEELSRHPAVLAMFQEKIDRHASTVASWEGIKRFILRAQPFGVATGELTVSLKLKREVVYNRHLNEIEDLYRIE
jgi:long-chain acyl-CoA synthetase